MSPELVLITLITTPVVVLFLLRVNAALIFLSLCLGNVLVEFAGHDVVSIVSGAATNAHTTASMIKLGLLLMPVILTLLFMIKTVRGTYKKFFNILPAIGAGLLLALLVVPLLPPGEAHNVMASSLWQNIDNLQSVIIAASGFVCLCFLLVMRPKAPSEDKHGKHH